MVDPFRFFMFKQFKMVIWESCKERMALKMQHSINASDSSCISKDSEQFDFWIQPQEGKIVEFSIMECSMEKLKKIAPTVEKLEVKKFCDDASFLEFCQMISRHEFPFLRHMKLTDFRGNVAILLCESLSKLESLDLSECFSMKTREIIALIRGKNNQVLPDQFSN